MPSGISRIFLNTVADSSIRSFSLFCANRFLFPPAGKVFSQCLVRRPVLNLVIATRLVPRLLCSCFCLQPLVCAVRPFWIEASSFRPWHLQFDCVVWGKLKSGVPDGRHLRGLEQSVSSRRCQPVSSGETPLCAELSRLSEDGLKFHDSPDHQWRSGLGPNDLMLPTVAVEFS
jgi:hypothetical protein